ncbi:telomerase inhibitor [Gnomoniopsis sp. IMI 355080]|nr:telomerase inhibitor [Gnomoniopsis sp. IMI 355080]
MALSFRSSEAGPSWVPLQQLESSDFPLNPSFAPTESQLESWGPNAALWNNPEGADLIIRCRPRGGREVYWKVHRDILVDMSEWMEKYMPPEAKDGSAVEWDLSNWDAGQLGAVLQYMYLEDFEGGAYEPDNPLNMESLVLNTVHFLAGTACLCRPMMDQAIDQIDDTTELVQETVQILRLVNIDEFESSIRRALLIMYDEPDQWRIRALRIVVGKLMAVCFPLILQSQRWDTYQEWWGMLRVRVVADHRWLYQAGMCQRNDVILAGFENLDVIWVKYRGEGWQPSDDLMFPDRKVEGPPEAPASAPPTPAGGKKKSKAIPIVDPSGKITSVPQMSASASTGKVKSNPPGDASSPALVQSVPDVEDPFTANSTSPVAPLFPDSNNPHGSAGRQAHVSDQSHSVFPPPFFVRPPLKTATSLPVSPQLSQVARGHQLSPVLPWLPDGPFYFAETSTGEPASEFSSKAAYSAPPSVFGEPSAIDSVAPSITEGSSCSTASTATSVIGESSSDSAAASSVDPLDSPTCRMAELTMGFDGSNDALVDEQATPRPPAGNLSFTHEKYEKDEDLSKEAATPRASMFKQMLSSEAVIEVASTPTAAHANRKNKKKKA